MNKFIFRGLRGRSEKELFAKFIELSLHSAVERVRNT